MAKKLTILASVVAASTAVMASSASAADSTLDKVLAAGSLTCGVSTGLPGFSNLTQRVNGKVLMLSTVKLWQQQYWATKPK